MKEAIPLITNELYSSKDLDYSISINSTSNISATADSIYLNEGTLMESTFNPTITINNKELLKKISGVLIYKRRPSKNIPPPTNYPEIKFTKNSYQTMVASKLYELSEEINDIPSGNPTYIKISHHEHPLLDLPKSRRETCNEYIPKELTPFFTDKELYE